MKDDEFRPVEDDFTKSLRTWCENNRGYLAAHISSAANQHNEAVAIAVPRRLSWMLDNEQKVVGATFLGIPLVVLDVHSARVLVSV
jgi:hypothetical protein